MELFFVLAWVALCGVVAWVASEKGRSGIGFFFLSFFFSPLIGILIAIALPSLAPAAQPARAPSAGDLVLCRLCHRPNPTFFSTCGHCGASRDAPPPPRTTKTCPICAETIQLAAIKCRFCGADQTPPAPLPTLHSLQMGKCPDCNKLRHPSVATCVYCNSTAPVEVPAS